MRRLPLFVSLLLVSSAVLAQKEGVIVLKSDQPYVSPFDKSPSGSGGPATALFPNPTEEAITHAPGEMVGVKIFEPDAPVKEVPVVKPAPIRKKEEARVVKKEEPRASKKEETRVVKKDETKVHKEPVVTTKTESKTSQDQASLIPPKDAQNEKSVLAPPPGLVLNETGLTSFGKGATPATSSPVPSTVAPIATTVVPALEAAVTAASVTAIVQGIEKPVETISPVQAKNDESIKTTPTADNMLPGWVLKAFLFFIIGGLMMLGAWYWIKRQALYGDPAFQDPWFRPVKR